MNHIWIFMIFLGRLLLAKPNQALFSITGTGYTEKCFRSISTKYFTGDQLKLVILDNYRDFEFSNCLDDWIIQTNVEQPIVPYRFKRVDVYLMLSQRDDWLTMVNCLSREETWNPRAKFVVIAQADPKNIFEIFSKRYVYNIVVLIESTENVTQVFSYFPYTYANIGKPDVSPVLLDTSVQGILQTNFDLFPNKLPRRWSNTTVRVTIKEYPPYTIVTDGNGSVRGIEVESLKIIQSVMEFKIKYLSIHMYWGMKLPNGSYSDALGDIQRSTTDVAVGAFHAVHSEPFDFDLSFSYIEDSLKWIVPAARPLLYPKSIMLIFDTATWIFLTVSLVIVSCVTRLVSNTSSESNQNIWNCIFMNFQALLNIAKYNNLTSTSFKITFAVWCLASYILTTAFQSKLLVIFSSTSYEKQVTSLQDILQTDMKFGFYKDMKNLFERTDDPREKFVLDRFVNCDPSLACLNETVVKRNLAVMKSERSIQSIVPAYLRPDGSCMFYIFKDGLRTTPANIFFTKGYPMFEQMDKVILELKSKGFIDHLYKGVQQYTNQMLFFERAKREIKSKILSFSN